jgi:hypothetical protein
MQSGPASPAPPEDTPLAAAAVAEVEVVEEAEGEQAEEDAVKMEEAEPEKPVKRGRGRPRRRPAPEGSGVVMVKRDLLASCMTCPLCKRLLRDATTISECLHTCEYPRSAAAPLTPVALKAPISMKPYRAFGRRFDAFLVLGAPDLAAGDVRFLLRRARQSVIRGCCIAIPYMVLGIVHCSCVSRILALYSCRASASLFHVNSGDLVPCVHAFGSFHASRFNLRFRGWIYVDL